MSMLIKPGSASPHLFSDGAVGGVAGRGPRGDTSWPVAPSARGGSNVGRDGAAPPGAHSARAVLDGLSGLIADSLPELMASRFDVEIKPDGSPVTPADKLMEQRIATYLAERLEAVTVIGEETFDERPVPSAGWVAVVDPIDGTENFCSGLKEWGVSVSLWRDRTHQASLLQLPELGERLLSGDRLPSVRSRIVGFSSTVSKEVVRQALDEHHEARIIGCAVYNLLNVIRGSFARFINPTGAHAWDLVAGVNLALDHGCDVLIDGETYERAFLEPGQKYRVDIRNGHHRHPG